MRWRSCGPRRTDTMDGECVTHRGRPHHVVQYRGLLWCTILPIRSDTFYRRNSRIGPAAAIRIRTRQTGSSPTRDRAIVTDDSRVCVGEWLVLRSRTPSIHSGVSKYPRLRLAMAVRKRLRSSVCAGYALFTGFTACSTPARSFGAFMLRITAQSIRPRGRLTAFTLGRRSETLSSCCFSCLSFRFTRWRISLFRPFPLCTAPTRIATVSSHQRGSHADFLSSLSRNSNERAARRSPQSVVWDRHRHLRLRLNLGKRPSQGRPRARVPLNPKMGFPDASERSGKLIV